MKPSKSSPYATDADILANAHISDQADIMCIDQLTPEVQAHIASGRQSGLHLVSVRWLTGQFALMFCEPGSEFPSAKTSSQPTSSALTRLKLFLKELNMKMSQPRIFKPFRAASRTARRRLGVRSTLEQVHIDPENVYEDLLPDLSHGKDGFAWACCPFHDDKHPSLCVNVVSGWYKCQSSSCGATGSTIVGFVGHLLGFDHSEARRHLEQHYG